jgi:hypothetical protein
MESIGLREVVGIEDPVQQRGASKENSLGLSPEKVGGRQGWHNKETKVEKSKHEEGHVAPGRGKSYSTRIK